MIKRLLLSLSLGVGLFAQGISPAPVTTTASASPNPLASIYNPAFDTAYYASLDPARLALTKNYFTLVNSGFPNYNPTQAAQLLQAALATGLPIDTNIMISGAQPWTTMADRAGYGYTWVPAFGQQAVYGSPTNPINAGTFSGPVPLGAIKVSINPADFPAYQAPATGGITPALNPIGPLVAPFGAAKGIGDWYEVAAGDTHTVGSTFTNGQTTWTKEAKGAASLVGGQVSLFWVVTATSN